MANPAVQNLLISKNKYYSMAQGMGHCRNGSCHKVLVSFSSAIMAKDVSCSQLWLRNTYVAVIISKSIEAEYSWALFQVLLGESD